MAFDIKGALAEGYTPTEIADYLGKQKKIDIAGARKEGYSDDEIISYLAEKKTAGPVEALVGGAKQLLSSSRTAIESPLGPSAAAVRGLERQAAMTEKPAGSIEELKRVYEQEGLFPAAKEAASQAPSVIAGQAPFLAEMYGGARIGGTFFGVPGAIGGALLGPLVSYIGSNLERQAQTQMQEGKPVDVDLGAAALAALPQAALDVGAMEFGLGRLLKINPKLMGTERAEKLASESLIKMTAKGAAKTAAAEMPTEVIQQMIERKQAGLSLTSPDAMAEYADVLYQTGLMSPLGSMSRYLERGDAQRIMERQNKLIAAEQQRIADLKADAIKQRTFAEVNAAKAAEDALAAQQAREAALREPLTTQMELELPTQTTVEEVAARRAAAQPQGDLFTPPAPIPEAPAPTPEVLLDDDTIKSFGFASKGSNAFKALQSINDPAMPAENKLELFDAVIGAKGRLTPQQTNAVTAFREKLAVEPTEVPDVVSEAQPTADRTGVQPPSELGGTVAPVGVRESDLGGVAPVGVTPRQPDGREVTEQAPVAAAPESVAPESTEVMKVKEDLKAIGEELESEDQLKAARSLQSELRALDPYHPMLEDLGSPDVTPDVMAAAREEVDAIKAEKAKREPTSQRELRELRDEMAATEGEPQDLSVMSPEEIAVHKENEFAKFEEHIADKKKELQALKLMQEVFPEEANAAKIKEVEDYIARVNGLYAKSRAMWERATEVGKRLEGIKDVGTEIDTLYKDGKVTAYQYDLLTAIRKGETREAIKLISENAENGALKLVAKLILKSRTFPSSYITSLPAEEGITQGSYASTRDTVKLDAGYFIQLAEISQSGKDIDRVFMHELIHSATVNTLGGGYAANRVLQNIGEFALTKDQKTQVKYAEAADNIIKLFDYLAARDKNFTGRKIYGATNPFEMLSEAFTNPEFQDYLKGIKVPAELGITEPKQTLWDTFINSLKRLLGIEQAPDSALSQVLTNGAKLIEQRSIFSSRKGATPAQETGHKALHEKYGSEGDAYKSKKLEPAKSPRLEALFEQAGGKTKMPKPTALQDFKDDPRNYVEQRKKEGSRFLSSLETNWFDSGAFMQSQLRKGIADLGRSWDEVRQMLYQASTSQALHAEGVAHEFLDKGAIRYDPETYKYIVDQGATSWRGAIEAIKAAAAANNISVNDMTRYAHQALVARRLKGLMARNVELETRARQLESERDKAGANKLRDRMVLIHLSPEQIDAGMQLFSSLKGMDQIVSQWDGVRQNVLNFAVDSGLYSREDADVLLDVMDYVPFYREEQIEAKAGPREYSRGLLDTAAEKRLKGSMQDVNDVFDNMERWASYVVRKGIANKTAQNLVDAAQRYLPEGEVMPVDRTARGMRENTVAVWRDGDLQKYTFADPLYVKAFTGIESVAIPGFKALANISNILRQNIVLNPLFSIGQLSQDAFGAMFVSGVKHPFALPAQALKEFVGTLRGTSKTHEELKRLGVVGHRDYSAQVSRMDAEIAAGLREPGLFDKLKAPFQKLSMASDNAIRQAIYNQTLKETGDKALAVERAFEVINFRRAGASPANSMLRQTVPFFGAYLQAMNVAMKVIAGRGIAPTQKAEAYKILASTTAKVMLLSFIYSAMTADDDDYTKLDPTVRDRHLIIPGTGGLMIPIRPDVFTLFAKILPEHIYNLTMAEATEDGTKAKRALSDGLANAVLGPNVLPQGIKPVFEVMTNHNFFTGRPIVGMGQEMLDPERQYSLNTSELAKTMGSAMGISPMKIDHLLKAYFGYTGGTILMGMDHAIADAKGAPRPDKTYQDLVASIPGMGAFVSREFGTREMSDYYELRDMVNKSVNTFNYLKEHGTREERLAYREDKKELLAVKSRVNKINENLAKLRTMERKVVESTELTPEEKQEKIRTINLRRQQMLSTIGELRKRAGL